MADLRSQSEVGHVAGDSTGAYFFFAIRVAAAFFAASLRFRVRAAFAPAALRFRVKAAFFAAALRSIFAAIVGMVILLKLWTAR
jgi:hypothetical protein